MVQLTIKDHFEALRNQAERQYREALEAIATLEIHFSGRREQTRPAESDGSDEPSELDDATDVAEESESHFDGSVSVKPKLVEALTGYDDGRSVEDIIQATGLRKDRVRAGLTNHRNKTFERLENGDWRLIQTKQPHSRATAPKTKPAPPAGDHLKTIIDLLRREQPMDLDEIATVTRIPRADCFKVLADETEFERDTERMYWLAKQPTEER